MDCQCGALDLCYYSSHGLPPRHPEDFQDIDCCSCIKKACSYQCGLFLNKDSIDGRVYDTLICTGAEKDCFICMDCLRQRYKENKVPFWLEEFEAAKSQRVISAVSLVTSPAPPADDAKLPAFGKSQGAS